MKSPVLAALVGIFAFLCALSGPRRALGDDSDISDLLRDGRVPSRLTRYLSDPKVQDRLKKISRELDKKRKQQQKKDVQQSVKAIEEMFNKGSKAFQEKRYSAAYSYFEAVASSTLKEAAKRAAEANAKLLEIEAMAMAKLDEAQVLLYRGLRVQAVEALREVIMSFPYCEATREGKKKLSALASDPSVAAELRYVEGKAHEQAENYFEALKIYDDVINRWPEELAALRANAASRGIRKDPEKVAAAQEAMVVEAGRVAPGLLNMARNYMANEVKDRARRKLNEVISRYEGTDYAEEAKELLSKL